LSDEGLTRERLRDLEIKWQRRWAEGALFVSQIDATPKYYVLEMFPYPSGELHMGHVRNYSIGDAFARYKRMQGFNVLHPMGFDSFGLPAENSAIQHGENPQEWTQRNIARIKAGLQRMGFSYDWTREIRTHRADYYRWNQWLFLQFYERGLAYRKRAPVNWCPRCRTVLANEQVLTGECWRCSTPVVLKEMTQWFLRITAYADTLHRDLAKLGAWPDRVTTMQANWIGRSEGVRIDFHLAETGEPLPVFTTRPDTLFGVTFLAVAPTHPNVHAWSAGTPHEAAVQQFVADSIAEQRFDGAKAKDGLYLGKEAVNPATQEVVPIYVTNFALMTYGTGVIMGVPAHDQRDYAFARQHHLPIRVVVQPEDRELLLDEMQEAYVQNGILTQSGPFTGLRSEQAMDAIADWLERTNQGKRTTQYKLRDWLISRQRYWGTPIPIVYCPACGIVPEDPASLPIRLPIDVTFTGQGNPLDTSPTFRHTRCPRCGGTAHRETDTMDTFVDSSWYYLRFCDPLATTIPFSNRRVHTGCQ
jgi:leucyl-tRNA synthetase